MPTVIDAAEFQKNLPKYLNQAGKKPVVINTGRLRRVLISEADLQRTQPIYIFEDGSTIEPIYDDDPDAEIIRKSKQQLKAGKLKTSSLEEVRRSLKL